MTASSVDDARAIRAGKGRVPVYADPVLDVTDVRLPTRHEDLDAAFRGRLRPVPELLEFVQRGYQSMRLSGGIRFLPAFGRSGSGKSCAALELATHLPDTHVFELSREEMASRDDLEEALLARRERIEGALVVAVVDQYEEVVPDEALPARFVEWLSLLDRGAVRTQPTLVIWLTTSREFQQRLADATGRNERILLARDFELEGPARRAWPDIIEETFEFHNRERPLADYEVLRVDLEEVSRFEETLGAAIAETGVRLSSGPSPLQDFSTLQVVHALAGYGRNADLAHLDATARGLQARLGRLVPRARERGSGQVAVEGIQPREAVLRHAARTNRGRGHDAAVPEP